MGCYNGRQTWSIRGWNSREEQAAEETEEQQPEHVQVNPDVEQVDPQQPRRSTRQSTRPSYLEDYVLLADIECEFLLLALNDKPINFQEANKLVQ